MSWTKRRGQPSPNPTNPGITMYNPNQHSNSQQAYQQWQPNTQQYTNNWYGQPKPSDKNSPNTQPYGQQNPQQNYWQQPSYQPQNYQSNQSAEYDRYNQHGNYYENQSYGDSYQQSYNQHHNYQEQLVSNSQEKSEGDSWNWGWEDTNSNQQSSQQNNQQNLTESFANDESWNWSVDEATDNKNVQNNEQLVNKNIESVSNRQVETSEYENVTANTTLEQLPHANVTRLTKNENLTPQWSIESQISQDSSDDIILTSESDNRSNILSRSSTISHSPSRPASTHDNNTDPPQKNDDQTTNQVIYEQQASNPVYHEDDMSKSMQNLSLNPQFENKEIVSPENVSKEELQSTPPINRLMHHETTPPPPRHISMIPPPSSDPNKNPYKRTTVLSHSAANKVTRTPKDLPDNILNRHENLSVNLETLPDNSERPDQFPVENVQKTVRKTSQLQQQWHAENLEVAPINDRNQYLETGQLSDADPVYNQNSDNYETDNAQGASADNIDSLPPPGLRRVVPGQLEQSETNLNVDNVDEPPPGLSRMVLGRTETESTNTNITAINNSNVEEPPLGLHRMVPGESSSPESSSYPRYPSETAPYQSTHFDEDNYASESELNQITGMTAVTQRSATIGADTPPATNQQTNIASYSSSSSIEPIISRVGAVGIDSERRETNLDGANTLDESLPSVSSLPPDNNRRDNIDGGPQEDIMIRNQTVGQNTADNQSSNGNQQDKGRKSNRTYTTDSDHEQKERHRSSSPNRYEKDRRYYDDRRDRLKDRESPDKYRKYDRRHERHRGDKRYDEDTDYYSDKERNERRMRDERDDYDRRYNSLRRDKDWDKRRRDVDRDDRRNEYYYRYDDDYYSRDPNRSRPSSRLDSMHDSYRDRSHRERDLDRSMRHRDRDKDHRRRDPYNQYYQGYNYDPYNPYYQQYQQYQYYENLRRTNPQAYAEWYRKYYQQQSAAAAAYNPDDRASVHSGRSSANGDINKDRYTRQSYYSQQSYSNYYREIQNASTVYTVDDSRLMDNTDSSLILEDSNIQSQRLTPAKFSTAHVKASISSGYLLNVLPHYPLDGQPATIEIINVQSLLQNDEEMEELSEFPGPLINGTTHKKTVIDYCENKIKKANNNNNIHDVESYILMWELLILLLRQNGMVVGTDIAELLMKNHSSSTSYICAESEHDSNRASPAVSQHKEEYITDKFREYLIYGSGKEALEWAMKHGLWGHALFLASKLDKRTYANVMMRFANGLTMNDPLQTLYQLLSGRQPAAVTCVADEKWGDWRPHLAMILSNTTQRPELDRKAITTLGDTLSARGSIYAAHFCYLMAQVEFGRYGTSNTKVVLLGSSHNKPFNQFATNEAIFMTEIYEYACSLSDFSFMIPEFLPYKYLLATKFVDHGFLETGLQYLERIADGITTNPNRVQLSLVAKVCQLSDRLKYFDPLQADDLDSNRADATWLSNLKTFLNDINQTLQTSSQEVEYSQDIKGTMNEQYNDQQWQTQQQADYYQQTEQQITDYNLQTYQELETVSETVDTDIVQEQQQQQQNYWNQQQQQTWDDTSTTQIVDNQQNTYWNNQQIESEESTTNDIASDESKPQITMPNQSRTYDEPEDTDEPIQKTVSQPSIAKPKPATPVQPKAAASTGWFGGIWNKLSLRPKNQMKLPDDKNPTIVWDSEKKRWVNLEADQDDATNEIKPPPKMSELYRNKPPTPQNVDHYQTMNNSGSMSLPPTLPSQNESHSENIENNDGPPKPSQPNMYKLQRRGRNIKNAYVDVFNPSGVKTSNENVPSAEEVFGAIPSVGTRVNYFVPAPVSDSNAPAEFLTAKQNDDNNLQLSRWSSTSSLSREVQSYTQKSFRYKASPGGPMMYNPNDYNNTSRGKNH